MKPVWIGAAAAGILALSALVAFNPWVRFGPTVSACMTDDEIDASTRAAVDREAVSFENALTGSASAGAYAELSAAGQAAVSKDQLESGARQIKAEAANGPPEVSRTLLIQGIDPAHVRIAVPCNISQNNPETVAVEGAATEAHVLLIQALVNAKRTFDVWLVLEGGRWRVNGFIVHLSEIAGRSGKALWEQAKQQRARGHLFNAALLYAAASTTLNGGTYYQSPDWLDFQKDYGSFTPPPPLQGKPPYRWTLGGRTYPVNGVEFMGVDNGQVMLVIYQTSAVWNGDADADRRNRQTIDSFVAAFPEWSETFEAVAVRSMKPDNKSGWGTVYERGKGYVEKTSMSDRVPA